MRFLKTLFIASLALFSGMPTYDARPLRAYSTLLPGTPANLHYKITSYGKDLERNKRAIVTAAKAKGVSQELTALLIATGFQETTKMTAAQRDASKDANKDGSANYSLWNLSQDLIQRVGYKGDLALLNKDSQVPVVIDLIMKGIKKYGVVKYLRFVRAGATGLESPTAYGSPVFLSSIATMLRVIDNHPQLLTNDKRIEIDVPHV